MLINVIIYLIESEEFWKQIIHFVLNFEHYKNGNFMNLKSSFSILKLLMYRKKLPCYQYDQFQNIVENTFWKYRFDI